MSKVTATCIGKCLVTFDVLNKADMEATVPLTYVDQLVPMPLNMFPYEKYIDSSKDILNCIALGWANSVLSHDEACHIDVTGNRVASYYDVASICLQLQLIKQQFSRYVVCENAIKYCGNVPEQYKTESLNQCMISFRSLGDIILKGNILETFLYKSMSHWNQHSETILEIMVPPATGDNEARTKGYGAALIKLMANVGLLEYERQPSSAIGSSTYTPTFTLACNIDDKLMYLCLDGMSIN
jgi:hypothetical protein